jgi:hypothetical protein
MSPRCLLSRSAISSTTAPGCRANASTSAQISSSTSALIAFHGHRCPWSPYNLRICALPLQT